MMDSPSIAAILAIGARARMRAYMETRGICLAASEDKKKGRDTRATALDRAGLFLSLAKAARYEAEAYEAHHASVDGRRMAETGTGSGRSPTSAIGPAGTETPKDTSQ